ncbi:hypothetical protein T01_15355 [Trichinella spiralis]|uniref:Uncharacterized protein n=1 Tax=Trichinella spiralis TaxID=6334 RepID=A0A0V1BWU6_TRISP|nr:hypothetical protein T01_15355 [Trichinella spiralis]
MLSDKRRCFLDVIISVNGSVRAISSVDYTARLMGLDRLYSSSSVCSACHRSRLHRYTERSILYKEINMRVKSTPLMNFLYSETTAEQGTSIN